MFSREYIEEETECTARPAVPMGSSFSAVSATSSCQLSMGGILYSFIAPGKQDRWLFLLVMILIFFIIFGASSPTCGYICPRCVLGPK